MKFAALGLVGVIFAEDGLARAQQEPPRLPVGAQAFVQRAQGAVVHIESSDRRASVQGLTQDNEWIVVCSVPCDEPLDPSFDYRIGGRGLRATARFRVPPQGQLFLRADMKPIRNIVLGATFAGVGGLLLLSGFIEITVGMFVRASASSEQDAAIAQSDREAGSFLSVVGAVSAIAGAVMLIPGFIFFESGTKSTLQTSADRPPRRTNLRIIPGGFAF